VSIDLARTQYLMVLLDIRPNVVGVEQHFPPAISVTHLRSVVLIQHEMPKVMIGGLPKHQFVIPMVG